MTGFDFVVIGILLLSALLGLWRGLVHELMALLGWPFALILCKLFAGDLAPLLPLKQDTARLVVAYALVFIAALIVWSVLTRLLAKLLKAVGTGWSDKLLGGLFGLVRGAMLLLVLVWMVGLTNYFQKPFWRDALTTGTLERAALLTRSWLPDSVAQRIHYGIRN
jgi:membrane protein required for colicin V production